MRIRSRRPNGRRNRERAEDAAFSVYPAIIKPAAEHCSYGITRQSVVLNDAEARAQAANVIAKFQGARRHRGVSGQR